MTTFIIILIAMVVASFYYFFELEKNIKIGKKLIFEPELNNYYEPEELLCAEELLLIEQELFTIEKSLYLSAAYVAIGVWALVYIWVNAKRSSNYCLDCIKIGVCLVPAIISNLTFWFVGSGMVGAMLFFSLKFKTNINNALNCFDDEEELTDVRNNALTVFWIQISMTIVCVYPILIMLCAFWCAACFSSN